MSKWPSLLVASLTLLGCRSPGSGPSPAPSATASTVCPVETVVAQGPGADAGASGLRFDGLYVADVSPRKHLRFYADGAVIAVSTSPDVPYSQVMLWFKKGEPRCGEGTYALDGDRLRFKTSYAGGGAVEYEGAIQPGAARLKWHSLINDARGEDVYRFMHLPVR